MSASALTPSRPRRPEPEIAAFASTREPRGMTGIRSLAARPTDTPVVAVEIWLYRDVKLPWTPVPRRYTANARAGSLMSFTDEISRVVSTSRARRAVTACAPARSGPANNPRATVVAAPGLSLGQTPSSADRLAEGREEHELS